VRGTSVLPRVLFSMFSGRMPVLSMFNTGAQKEAITNETEYWAYFRPRPADDPAPHEKAHWETVKRHWHLRQAHPELRSGRVEFRAVTTDDPAVFAFLRTAGRHASLVVLNFRSDPVTCRVRIDWRAAGIRPRGRITPRNLLTAEVLPATTAASFARGRQVAVAARNGVVLRLL
jgi:glycosidase